jgi:hypothetical protein
LTLFWLGEGAGADGEGADGEGADGEGAVVLAVVVLGVVVVEGLVVLFPPQPAVIALSATTMTAPAITRVWRAVGDDVTIRSSLLPTNYRSADKTLLDAVLRRLSSSRMRRSTANSQVQRPIRAHGRPTPERTSQPLQNFEVSLGVARINSCYLVGDGRRRCRDIVRSRLI